VRTTRPTLGSPIHLDIRHLRTGIATLAIALAAVGTASAEPSIPAKQAEARAIVAQIDSLDAQVGAAIERWNLANVKLDRIGRDLSQTRFELGVARSNLKRAQADLSRQAIEVYTSGATTSTLEVFFGATSLGDLLNRIDSVGRVSQQRTSLVTDVTRFRGQIQRQANKQKRAQTRQRALVAQIETERQSIEGQLQRRKELLASVQSEIVRLEAAERAQARALAQAAQAQQRAQTEASASQSTTAAPAAAEPVVGVSASTPEATVAPPSTHGGVVGVAMQYLGVPYVWGGASPSGFDCSGLIMYAYAQIGVSLPHSTYALWGMGVPVSRDQLAPGDIVFFSGLGHAGIYAGGGSFVHAPHTGDVVKVSSMSGWYASSYVGARRIL
jgi:peptidoglycan DL-endopeptidase CwlO